MKRTVYGTALCCCVFLCLPMTGCTDRPEMPRKNYGKILNALPVLEEAEKPFEFPYSGETDHRNCQFNENDLF